MVDRRSVVGWAAALTGLGLHAPRVMARAANCSPPVIKGAPTSICALIGYSHPLKTAAANFGKPVQIQSFSDYQRQFGGAFRSVACVKEADRFGDLAHAVSQFFVNGGTTAVILALNNPALPRTGSVLQLGPITFTALQITDAASAITIDIKPSASSPPGDPHADIAIVYGPAAGGAPFATESYAGVSLNRSLSGNAPNPAFVETRIGTPQAPVSALVTAAVAAPAGGWTFTVFPDYAAGADIFAPQDFVDALAQGAPLDQVTDIGLMVLPGVVDARALKAAIEFCERKKAFLLMDPPADATADGPHPISQAAADPGRPRSANAALFFPYLTGPDLFTGAPSQFPPAGSVAGVYAANDAARGVWKAAAGMDAAVAGVTGVAPSGVVTETVQGALDPLDVDCLRAFPGSGVVVWGARTFSAAGDTQWTYTPVRRLALYLESSIQQGLAWTAFEPNASPLWSSIRLTVGAFLQSLFLQGAFQGTTPQSAYFVKCDSSTTSAADIANGVVNILIGFAPLTPAEFIVIQIQVLSARA